ncbi:MAG: hypothetical protein NTW05_06355, partial [Pseudonocardiales bacterium]|nr:hypothetical protein [Pseudonocardiales bacterium]
AQGAYGTATQGAWGGAGWGGPPPGQGPGGGQAGWASHPSHPSHPAQPGYPPPPRRSSRTPLIVAGVVAALVLVGGGIAAALTLTGGDGDGDGTTTTAVAQPTTPPVTTTTAAPEPTADPAVVTQLLADLPEGYDASNCVEDVIEDSPAIASVACSGPPSVGSGPEFASFSRYDSRADMAQDFATLVDEADAQVTTNIADCGTAGNVRIVYTRTDGTEGGELGCYVLDDGKGVLVWTDERVDALGYVYTETGDVAALYSWWNGIDFVR